jgi:hypothetical protein
LTHAGQDGADKPAAAIARRDDEDPVRDAFGLPESQILDTSDEDAGEESRIPDLVYALYPG